MYCEAGSAVIHPFRTHSILAKEVVEQNRSKSDGRRIKQVMKTIFFDHKERPMRYLIATCMVLALMLIPASHAYACSGGLPTIQTMTQGAQVIAVGTLAHLMNNVITLNVEEYLQGEIRTPTLHVNNHKFGNNEDCSIILGTGGRFQAAIHVLVFLQRDEFRVGADWRPTGVAAMDVLTITDGQLFYIGLPMGPLNDAKTQIAALAGPAHAPDQPTSLEPRCFVETNLCIRDRFLAYWEQNGGLAVFGYPTTAARAEVNRDTGTTYLTQWFERARFEWHKDRAAPYDVQLGRVGDDLLLKRGIDWHLLPGSNGPVPVGCLVFGTIGNVVCDQQQGIGFKTYWETHGLADAKLTPYQRSLALFGMAITMPRMETNSSGETVLTQWFERARFEWHPDKPNPYSVLLGRLGSELR
ncbi:MAG: hypothetical protein H0X37_20080 [Herpetosiphonaceae bacterium]|nr:hypothetical protein [Herpetosiphonaceae bacterium]